MNCKIHVKFLSSGALCLSLIHILVRDPNFQSQFSDLTLQQNDVLVVSGDRKMQISSVDLFNTCLLYTSSPRLPTGFLVSRGTLDPARCARFSDTGLSPSLAGLPMPFS